MGPVRESVKEYVLVQSSKWKELRDKSRNLPRVSSVISESEDVSKPAKDVAKDVTVIKSEPGTNGETDVMDTSLGPGEGEETATSTSISASEVVRKPKSQEVNAVESTVVDSSAGEAFQGSTVSLPPFCRRRQMLL